MVVMTGKDGVDIIGYRLRDSLIDVVGRIDDNV